jgi:hypothetical protein
MIAFAQHVQAQPKYGISAITTVTPPYPITLDGFVAEGGTKIALQILPTDVTIAQYPVLLKLVISGNGITLESKTLTIHEPVYLNGNEITRLDGNDLQAFFNPDNLIFNGYSKTQYQRNGRLPEGVYTVGFELYDVLRKIQVASVKSTLVFLFLNEVPSLNLPLNNDVISAAGTQVVNFRWSTRHSPLAATFFTPQYLFELWDIQPDGMNPYEVVRGTRPVYASTVSSTYVSYGVTEPPLLPGHTYAWRVRETDPDGKTLFKNEGYSEVYTFKYGVNCPVPELKADKAGTSNLSVLWQASPDQNKFELRYRDKKKKNPEWYTQSVNTLSSKVENLKSNTVYEIEVCAICGDQRSEYSNRLEMNTRQNTSFKCGQIDSSKLPQNQNPLRKLSHGDVFKAFGFDVEVKEASGSGGTFTGKGYVLVPLLNFIKIEAKFDNARINEDYQLIGGEVKTVYNLKNSLTYIPGQGVAGLSDLTDLAKLIAGDKEKNKFDDLADKKIEIDSVKDIKIEGNKIVVTDANGKTEEVPLSAGKVVSIKTDEGKEYVIDSNGTIYSSGNSGQKAKSGTPSGPITTAAQAGKGSPKYNVSFIPHKLQEYGFDYPTDKSPKDNYEQVNLTENPMLVPWKSLEAGHIERTVAEITGGPADSVRYYRQSNNVVMTAPGEKATQQQIMLNGNGKNDEDKLFAWYAAHNQADTGKTYARVLAGQLNLITYEKKSIKVVLVPVNNASCPDAAYVKTELNKIYKSAVVDWDVAQGNNIKVTFTGSVFDNTDPDDRMNYTDDMKAAISVLKEDAQYNRETYYLFFLDNAKDPSTKGYMPLKQQFGFIFKYKQYPDEYLRTIAHELGHGPFRLWHTFSNSNKYIQPQGTTDNLMDYANASALKLNKYQWDWMHDPEWRLYWFTEEDEAAAKSFEGYYLCPNGAPIYLPKTVTKICFVKDNIGCPRGSLLSFIDKGVGYMLSIPTPMGQVSGVSYHGYCVGTSVYPTKSDYGENIKIRKGFRYLGLKGEELFAIYESNYKTQKSYGEYTLDDNDIDKYYDVKKSYKVEDELSCNGCDDDISEKLYGKKGKYNLTVRYNKTKNKWSVFFKLEGNPANSKVKSQRERIERQVSDLMTEKINELKGVNGDKSKAYSQKTEDGGDFLTAEMNGLGWLSALGDLGSSVWEEATLPKGYWNKENGYETSSIHVPPTLSGVGDGAIDLVSDYPQLIKMAYDVATKEEVRNGIWESVKNISPSSVKSMVTDAVKSKIDNYNFSDKPYLGYHEIGKDGVAVINTLMGGAFTNVGKGTLENGIKETGDKIKNSIKKKLEDIEKYFDTKEFADRVKDRLSKYKGELTQEKWLERYKTLIKNREIGKLTEEQFEILEGGAKPKKCIKTTDGRRYFDNVLDDVAREVKSGPVTLSQYRDQILKDIEIIKLNLTKGQVNKIEWHCFDGVEKSAIDDFIKAQLKDKSSMFEIIRY